MIRKIFGIVFIKEKNGFGYIFFLMGRKFGVDKVSGYKVIDFEGRKY